MNVSTRMFSIVGLAVMALRPGIGLADDTDIYVNNAPAPGGEPMVMFSLDYRPNLGSTACQGTECAGLIAEGYLPVKASYTFFDVLRAVLKKVMQPLAGVKVGLMINHDYTSTTVPAPPRWSPAAAMVAISPAASSHSRPTTPTGPRQPSTSSWRTCPCPRATRATPTRARNCSSSSTAT